LLVEASDGAENGRSVIFTGCPYLDPESVSVGKQIIDSSSAVKTARALLDAARRVVVLTGAGISTDSGIPDFRGPKGVWTRNPAAERLSDIRYYLADSQVRKASWESRLEHPAWTAQPNAGHLALVALERRGKLHALITQNIDGLHQRAGNSPDFVIEVHGNVHQAVCLNCGWKGPMQHVLERVRGGEEDPPCNECGGILKSDTISFGQALVPEVIARAMDAARDADLLLAVGTSLQVYPVAGAVPVAKAAGARIVIMNAQPTQFDEIADVVLNGAIGADLPRICRAPGVAAEER
jgi:NAD-dependent deacetylase